jgi:hypothetical protein
MARGWESKSAEAQVSEFQAEALEERKPKLTEEQLERARQKSVLLLARARVEHGMESCTDPRYREQLTRALAHLDRQLAELTDPSKKD